MRTKSPLWMRLLAATALLFPAHAAAAVFEPTISSTNSHVLVSRSDGSAVGWGSDLFGKLGTGRAVIRYSPGQVAGLPPITQIASYAYGYHFVALDTNGRVWSWGQNDAGQLGPRVRRDASRPARVSGLSGVIQVAATSEASLALKSDGTVWIWGSGPFGDFAEPTQVAGLSNVVQITAGSSHYFARRSNGTVVGAGYNNQNQLGVGAPSDFFFQYPTPTPIPLPAGVVDVVATINGGAARTNDGKVWSWGATAFEGLGDALPREVTGFPSPPTKLVAGGLAYRAVVSGQLWQWATNATPSQVAGFTNVVDVGTDDYDFLVVDTNGRMQVRSSNAYGERGDGTTGLTDQAVVTLVPTPTNFKSVRWTSNCVLAVTLDGAVWAWGADVNGSFGDGAPQTYAVPRPISGLAGVKQVAAGLDFSAALDESGNVRTWGDNPGSITGDGAFSPSATPVRIPIAGIKAIAAGWFHLLMLANDGSVWRTGYFLDESSLAPIRVTNLPVIKAIAAGNDSSFAVDVDGRLWAWGRNAQGELGVGNTIVQPTPVEVAVPGGVSRIATEARTALAVTPTGDVYGWGVVDTRNLLGALSSPGDVALSPRKVAGIANAADVALGQFHYLARLGNGTVVSWGPEWQAEPLGRDIGGATPPHVPSPVLDLDSVTAIAAGNGASFAIRADGTVWGWGVNWASGYGPPVGDGTLVRRSRPVVVIRENGGGNLDTNDWFLDAKPGTPKTIPAAKVPKVVPLTRSLSSTGLLNIDASVNVRQSDQAKKLGLYVVGLVPPAFLDQVKSTPKARELAASAKADQLILVNLTPAGWAVASGQLAAYQSGVGSAALAASNLLVNINPATIPGARFCIGYGESASDMLSTGTIRDFISLEGASTSALGLPCLLSGVYVDGPPTSPQGSAVPLRAVVVGQSPAGTVRFKERFTDISADVAITPVNSTVSQASVSYTPPGAGEYAFGASYPGDGLNAAASTEIPLRHVVSAVQASTTTRIDAPVASEIGMELRLVAHVSGNRPGGTVQFKRGGVNEGAPVPVVGDEAVLAVLGLGIGDYSFTAVYSGDTGNQPSTSAAFAHTVLDVATSAVSLESSANPVGMSRPVTLTVSVTGSSPMGTATLREDGVAKSTVPLANGSASFSLAGLTAGVHVFSVDYSGDGTNPPASSNALFQQVRLVAPVRLGNISTRMQVLTGNDVMIGGFIIGGATPKTVVVRARGPSLIPFGITNALADPKLDLFSAQTVIATNDDFGSAANLAALQASGFAPGNPKESAILATLNPGAYTAIVSGVGNTTGVGIVEVFEVDHPEVPLANISTRGQVLTGNDVMIGGFIIQGDAPQTVVVRARGPSLIPFGITNALANPVLQLFSGQTMIASNDDWGAATNAAQIQSSGFAPSSALESAILITLNPGAYTAIVTGAGGGTGVGIVEVFAQ